MAREKVIATRGINNASTGLPGHVENPLEGGGIVSFAVAIGTKITDRKRIRILRGSGCHSGVKDQPPNDFGPQSYPFHKCIGAVDALWICFLLECERGNFLADRQELGRF